MLAEALKSLRESRELSPEHFAQLIGVSDTYVRQIESGMRAQMSWDLVRRTARVLRVPLYVLVSAVWPVHAPISELRAAGLPEDRQDQLARLWPRVPQRLRPTALQVAFALARVETVLDGTSRGSGRPRP